MPIPMMITLLCFRLMLLLQGILGSKSSPSEWSEPGRYDRFSSTSKDVAIIAGNPSDSWSFAWQNLFVYFRLQLAGQIVTSTSAGVVSTFTWDANGNLSGIISGGNLTTMSYDKENRMQTYADSGGVRTFTYDGDGLGMNIDRS